MYIHVTLCTVHGNNTSVSQQHLSLTKDHKRQGKQHKIHCQVHEFGGKKLGVGLGWVGLGWVGLGGGGEGGGDSVFFLFYMYSQCSRLGIYMYYVLFYISVALKFL